jgi:4-oxalmesaconate hydratase/OH-DDVA meta-cleavage compound hydrolase
MDDVGGHLHTLDWLSEADRKLIFEDNARRVFKLDGRLNVPS